MGNEKMTAKERTAAWERASDCFTDLCNLMREWDRHSTPEAHTRIIDRILAFAECVPVQPSPPDERSAKDYAIEHAEYLAKAAEAYLAERNKFDELESRSYSGDSDALSDHFRALNSAIHEFRKRAKRALVEAGSIPQPQPVQCRDVCGGFVCTLKPGHDGRHEAWGTEEMFFGWAAEARSPKESK